MSEWDSYHIDYVRGLDPITFLVKQEGKTCKIIVECYCWAWAHYFSSISGDYKSFLSGCDSTYLAGKLICNQRTSTKKEEKYLIRICEAVIGRMKDE